MKLILKSFSGVVFCALASGCATNFAFAPGAEQVQVVRNPAGVASCTAVGNVDGERGDVRNLTVGLGGNTLFVTAEQMGYWVRSGVAYRCPK